MNTKPTPIYGRSGRSHGESNPTRTYDLLVRSAVVMLGFVFFALIAKSYDGRKSEMTDSSNNNGSASQTNSQFFETGKSQSETFARVQAVGEMESEPSSKLGFVVQSSFEAPPSKIFLNEKVVVPRASAVPEESELELKAESPLVAERFYYPGYYVVKNFSPTGRLNVRLGPGTSYDVIRTLPCGADGIRICSESEMNGDDEWILIETANGGTGWINRKYLNPTE